MIIQNEYETTSHTRAVIYARFSPRPNAEGCQSNKQQIESCEAYAKKHGMRVCATFEERAISGKEIEKRDELWSALSMLEDNWVLLVWKFDRLARDGFLHYTIEREVLKRKARIISCSGEGCIEENLSPEENLKLGIIRLFSEYERRLISLRTKTALRRLSATDKRMSAVQHLRYGTKLHPKDPDRVVPCEHELRIIDIIMGLHDEGQSTRKIIKSLGLLGIGPRKAGKQWSPRTIDRIIAYQLSLREEQ